MTNGPYRATGSPIGRPWSSSASTSRPPASSGTGTPGRSTSPVSVPTSAPSTARVSPSNTYSTRDAAALAAGSSQAAPGSRRRCQIATSASGRDAHELGGGGGGTASPSAPATTVISVVRPASSVARTRGMSPSHSIVKYGSTSLSSAARLTQIW